MNYGAPQPHMPRTVAAAERPLPRAPPQLWVASARCSTTA